MRALELERHHRSSLKAVFIGLKATAEGVTVKETLIKPSLLGDICHVLANETTMCRF